MLNDAALGNKTLSLTTSSSRSSDLISTKHYRNHLAKNSTPPPYCSEINISFCVWIGTLPVRVTRNTINIIILTIKFVRRTWNVASITRTCRLDRAQNNRCISKFQLVVYKLLCQWMVIAFRLSVLRVGLTKWICGTKWPNSATRAPTMIAITGSSFHMEK